MRSPPHLSCPTGRCSLLQGTPGWSCPPWSCQSRKSSCSVVALAANVAAGVDVDGLDALDCDGDVLDSKDLKFV